MRNNTFVCCSHFVFLCWLVGWLAGLLHSFCIMYVGGVDVTAFCFVLFCFLSCFAGV